MIKANNKKIKGMLLVIAVMAVALGVFRTLILVNYIEPETGFYVSGTNIGTVFAAVTALVVLIIGMFGFFTRKIKAPEFLDSHSTVVVFSSALCAFMYITVFLYGVYSLITASAPNYFLYAQVVLCIPCMLNHISICSKEVREKNTPQSLLAMSEAVFFAVRIVEAFMDTNHQINVSQRSLELVMLCAIMMFFLIEAKFQIKSEDTESGSISKYFMAALATVALSVVTLIPYLLVCLFWCFEAHFIVMDVLECCVMIFAASRVLTLRDN